jgi:hypothetical protein
MYVRTSDDRLEQAVPSIAGRRLRTRQLRRCRVASDGSGQLGKAPWYTPWIEDKVYAPGDRYAIYNSEPSSLTSFDSGWQKDAVGTALLSAVAGMAGSVLLKRLGLSALIQLAGGGFSAFLRSISGLKVQERISGNVFKYHNVYGRYRINMVTNKIIAAEFRGIGPSKLTMAIPWSYQQRIVDNFGKVYYTHPSLEMSIPGLAYKPPQWPEHNFGSFGSHW